MFKITKAGVFSIFSILLFCCAQIFIHQYSIETKIPTEIMKNVEIKLDDNSVIQTIEKNEIWKIDIPKISLTANIAEGTTKDILDEYVGHFENTSKDQGNIGLAAHNRGYAVNYFKDLKLLKKGDEIIYTHNNFQKIYEVEKCKIIKETDWSFLKETEENMLTLITCVENEPEYRRCIQAIEKEEENY